jgi:hypothetical protein
MNIHSPLTEFEMRAYITDKDEAFNTAFVTGAIQASHTHILRNIAGIGSAPRVRQIKVEFSVYGLIPTKVRKLS